MQKIIAVLACSPPSRAASPRTTPWTVSTNNMPRHQPVEKKMRKLIFQSLFAIAGLAATTSGFALGGSPGPVLPVILSVAADFKQQTLVISGRQFGSSLPTVRLANTLLTVKTASTERIVASLPAGIQPATYRLTVTAQDGRRAMTSEVFHAALLGGKGG
jgi:hypothetical protein